MLAEYRTLINRDLPLVERGCTSKAAFLSRREARSLSHNGKRHADGQLKPYHCRNCDRWHLGHGRRHH
jgi:hypothetical protein